MRRKKKYTAKFKARVSSEAAKWDIASSQMA